MSKKLQNLSIKMVDLFPKTIKTPQHYFDAFKVIYKTQKDYFINFDPSDIVKLIFYIYSYRNTGNFNLAQLMLNKLSFAALFITQGSPYIDGCPKCYGDGETNCEWCGGYGQITCEECDGSGDDPMDSTESCNVCYGDGEIDCPECNAQGKEVCDMCDGSGEVETGELEYDYYVICTWNTFIKDQCELRESTLEPALSEYDFDRLRDDFIILGHEENHQRFVNEIQSNEVYCAEYSDEPELGKSYSSDYKIWMSDDNMEVYKK
jgi:hypothetical protein